MRTTQKDRILEFMRLHGSITQREALSLGIYRLGARIWELKNDGYAIKMELIRVRNADGSHSYVARYSLATEAALA